MQSSTLRPNSFLATDMAIELTMPALSPTMEKATLAKWLVAEGDTVKAGDLLAEIETDKTTMEYEAADDGRITRLVVAEGTDDITVGSVIALLSGADEVDAEAALPAAPVVAAASAPPAEASPFSTARRSPADRIRISPLVARIANAKGIDLSAIQGTGPNGRVVRQDLGLFSPLAAPGSARSALPAAAVATIAPPAEGAAFETIKLSSMRKTIARRLSESKQTVPHFNLTARCNLDQLLTLRATLNESLAASGLKLSISDLLIRALALALCEVPDAKVQFGGEMLHRFSQVDVSMAVAVDGGLVTPVLRDVGTLSLSAIAARSRALAAKAREGKLMPEDYRGGTVSLSNFGMFGIDEMFPVINPPQALILRIAAGIEQPWKVDGEIELATVLAATASFDHRAIDGAVAAEFTPSFRELVESPLRLAV